MTVRPTMHDSAPFVGECPPRTEQVERFGEYVVVDEARVDGKQAHEKNNVPSTAISGQPSY